MKKLITSYIFAITAMVSMIFMAGCDLNQAQIKTISNQAGLFSAVGWIAMDNPDTVTKENVKTIITLINDKAGSVSEGKTYTEVLYPLVLQYVVKNVEPQYRPLTKAGSLAMLGGIDMLLAANPDWVKDQSLVTGVVQSFCTGASNGLSLSADDPVMQSATRSAKMRAGLQLHK